MQAGVDAVVEAVDDHGSGVNTSGAIASNDQKDNEDTLMLSQVPRNDRPAATKTKRKASLKRSIGDQGEVNDSQGYYTPVPPSKMLRTVKKEK